MQLQRCSTSLFSSFIFAILYLLLQFSAPIGQLYPCKCIGAALQFHTGKSLITPGVGDISRCKHTVCASVVQAGDRQLCSRLNSFMKGAQQSRDVMSAFTWSPDVIPLIFSLSLPLLSLSFFFSVLSFFFYFHSPRDGV